MDAAAPTLIWILIVSGVGILTLTVAVIGAFGWQQQRAARLAREWGRRQMAVQDAEAARITAELHDDVVPRLYAVQLDLDGSGRRGAAERLGLAIADLRRLAHRTHPLGAGTGSLGGELRLLVADQFAATSTVATVEIDSGITPSEPAMMALYRIVQLALANIRAHASADAVAVTLRQEGDRLMLRVRDDGRGMPPAVSARNSFGLRSIKERAGAVGGNARIISRPGEGTLVEVSLPWP